MREFAEYLLRLASTPWGPLVMVLHSYLESFILPLDHALFLIPVALARPNLSFLYVLMSTVASCLGISTGYLIGHFGGKAFLLRFISAEKFLLARTEIHKYDAWAAVIACFTPIPVKVFAAVAGAVGLNFRKMIVIAFFVRGLRFGIAGGLIYFYGEVIREWILEYLGWVMMGILAVMVFSTLVWKFFERLLIRKEHLA